MRDAHRLPAAIQWHEGMLLAPQHFQQLSTRFDELLDHHLALITPFHWGIRRLAIDHTLLVDGTFRIQQFEAVMPDGLVVCDGQDNTENLEVDLTAHTAAMKKGAITIHLAVPQTKVGLDVSEGALARYKSVEGKPIADENARESELTIPRLVPCVSLLVTESPPQKYTSFPLVKIAYENETYALTEYIPPTLSVPVQSPLGEMCAATTRRLREKAVFLAESMRSPSAAMRGPMRLTTKSMVHSLVAALPVLEAVLNTGRAHPYALYLALCSVVGQIAALGRGLIPPVLAPYDHNDPRAAFKQALGFIHNMVDEGILESHTAIPFDLKSGAFCLTIEEAWITRELVIGVKAREGLSEKDTLAWMGQALIGSEPVIESMRRKRILGAKRRRIEGDDDLIPVRGVVLFGIEADPEFIQPDIELRIFNITEGKIEFRPDEIVLYVKN